jgi:hypothetical protein
VRRETSTQLFEMIGLNAAPASRMRADSLRFAITLLIHSSHFFDLS